MTGIFNDLCLNLHLILSLIMLMIGLFGIVFNKRSAIITIMSLELMFVAPIINFVFFSAHRNEGLGQVFSLFSLGVVAGEAVIGLALLLTYYRNKGNIKIDAMDSVGQVDG